MPIPGSVIDGAPGYGSVLLNFSSAGNFIAENINVSRSVQTARDRLTDGEPGRSRYTADFISLTATLQAPATFSGWPQFGETVTVTLDNNYGAETWIMMPPEVNLTNDPGSLRKLNIVMQKKNTATLTLVAAQAQGT